MRLVTGFRRLSRASLCISQLCAMKIYLQGSFTFAVVVAIYKYTCARLCIRTCAQTCAAHVLAGSENGTRLNGCGTRTKGEFLIGTIHLHTRSFECLSCLGPDVDNRGKTGEAQIFII